MAVRLTIRRYTKSWFKTVSMAFSVSVSLDYSWLFYRRRTVRLSTTQNTWLGCSIMLFMSTSMRNLGWCTGQLLVHETMTMPAWAALVLEIPPYKQGDALGERSAVSLSTPSAASLSDASGENWEDGPGRTWDHTCVAPCGSVDNGSMINVTPTDGSSTGKGLF